MNYHRIYDQLISSRKLNTSQSDYYEKHHIIPRSLGGTDEKSNLVKLTGREHFIAHLLLAKMYGGAMWFALKLMQGRIHVNSHTFHMIRRESSSFQSAKMKGRTPYNKGLKTPLNIRKKQSDAHKGKKLSVEHKNKVLRSLQSRNRDTEWSRNISNALKGHVVSQNTRVKISNSLLGSTPHNKGTPDVKVTCPHCGKNGGRSVMKRWHFEKCKIIQNNA